MKKKENITDPALTQERNEKEKDKKRLFLLLLLLLLLLFMLIISFLIWHSGRENATPSSGNTDTSPKIETSAEATANDGTDDNRKATEGGNTVTLNYAKEVGINLTEKRASLVFGNPANSNQDAAVQLIIRDTVIFQSDFLPPDTKISELDLNEYAAEKLTDGIYNGNFAISFLDRATGHQAKLNAQIPVTVTVTK